MVHESKTSEGEQLPPYVIEGARSGRSRCKTCRRTIAKGGLRIGVLIEGPFGTGYLWHHLKCLARARLAEVESAYELEAWKNAKERPRGLPKIEALRGLEDKARQQRAERRQIPYVEIAPSARSKCKLCNEAIAEGAVRVVLGREVIFGQQVRTAPVKVHPACVAAELAREDAAVEWQGLSDALEANSVGIDPKVIEAALAEIGSGPEGVPA